ncbi:MAG: hypothetical protein IPO21_12815 [Bacteroidales bacterium]|nr:hypothetical protein [Bacteroidales bacterium]
MNRKSTLTYFIHSKEQTTVKKAGTQKEPSAQSIDMILRFAQSYNVCDSALIDKIEWNEN